MKKSILTEGCVMVIIILFTYTATSKFLNHQVFISQMQKTPVPLLKIAAPLLSWCLPLMEYLIVFGLLINSLRIAALYTTIGLLITFEIYISALLLSGMHLPCSCGGIIAKLSWKQHLIVNLIFIIIAAIPILISRIRTTTPGMNTPWNYKKDLSRAETR